MPAMMVLEYIKNIHVNHVRLTIFSALVCATGLGLHTFWNLKLDTTYQINVVAILLLWPPILKSGVCV